MKKNVKLDDLNERQLSFILGYAEHGDELRAYEEAGFSTTSKNWRGEARKKLRELSAYVEVAIHERIGGHIPLALGTIQHLCVNSSSDTVRLNAAKDLMARGGYDAPRVIEDNREKPSDMDRESILKELSEILGTADPKFVEKILKSANSRKEST